MPADFPAYVRWLDGEAERLDTRSRPLAFLHINKTAGTTFMQYLRSHYPDASQIAPPFFGDYAEIGISDPAKRLFWGHFPFWQFTNRRTDVSFITFLRHPVQRLVSQYKSHHNPANLSGGWQRVLPTQARKAMEFAHQATFEEFILSDDPFILGHTRDLQTQFLSSTANPDAPDFLSSAIHNLVNEIAFFGITEQFDESIALFQYQLGTDKQYDDHRQRRNDSKPYPIDVTPRGEKRIKQLVANDLRLYEIACREFERRRQACGIPSVPRQPFRLAG